MPGMSGEAVLERLVELGVSVPVVFVTGHPSGCAHPSAAGVIAKPTDRDTLLRAIRKVLDDASEPAESAAASSA
jgi:FixJ family two-component response regulator